ncbi:MAG: hypothetical protein AB1698_03585 [Pseudomonadota bacterium]
MVNHEDLNAYAFSMEQIKVRLERLRRVISAEITLGDETADYEIVALNLRKILELIAFSSLSANRESYAKVHAGYTEHWSAKKLLKSISAINPDFFPHPLAPEVTKTNGVINFKSETGDVLTRDDFEHLMDRCAEVIHVWNPYSRKARNVDFMLPIPEWLNRITRLLNVHTVRLAGTTNIILVLMQDPKNGSVNVCFAPDVTPLEG